MHLLMIETEARPSSMIRTEDRSGVRIITLDNPPVNALSLKLCGELFPIVEAASADPSVRIVVFTGAKPGFFSGGADINDFSQSPPPDAKSIRDVIAAIDKSDKTYVAAIDGNALGGGCELALACDYRVASATSKLGLPEILLGLIPGAGGTQRLPRLLANRTKIVEYGLQGALQFMLTGQSKDAKQAKAMGLLDDVAEGPVVDAAITFAEAKIADRRPKCRISEMTVKTGALPFLSMQAHSMIPMTVAKGGQAAHALVDALEAAVDLDFKFGIAREQRIFETLALSQQSLSYRHLFFAERELSKIPGMADATATEIEKAAVVGAGTMGVGIAVNFANAKIPVSVIDINPEQVERGKKFLADMYGDQVKKKRMTEDEAKARIEGVSFVTDYAAIADSDIVVEAVFESMAVKKDVFGALDKAVKPEAILATNTSTLDIDAIAQSTSRPAQVIGTHFFAPANIMQLLEVVRGKDSSPQAIATSMKLGRTLKKKGVLSGNAFGFIGNRMFFDLSREANYLIEEGALPQQVDKAIKDFGFALGPFATFDLSGLDVFHKINLEAPSTGARRSKIADRLYELGRYGQKTSAGFYRYDPAVGKGREAIVDPAVEAIIHEESAKLGIMRRVISDEEIVARCVYALANQGAVLLGDGVALRPGDIDIVWIYGYGFPPFRGGPMWYADTVGVKTVYAQMLEWKGRHGNHWEPAPLMKAVAESGQSFATYKA